MKWMYILCFVILASCTVQRTNKAAQILHTERDRFYIYMNQQKGSLPFAYLPRPFYQQIIVPDSGMFVRITSEKDSFCFRLHPNDKILFKVVDKSGDTLQSSVRGIKKVAPASFNDKYIRNHTGKNFIEIPKVYELINIIIAITPSGMDNENFIEMETPYYKEVLQHFLPYQKHPIIAVVDKMLSTGRYSYIKMDSYAYDFKKNKIINPGIYNRVSWGDYNVIEEYIPMIEDFARQSNFLSFYENHFAFYQTLIKAFEKHTPLSQMQSWLERNFPQSTFNSYKIIFSPLAGANQSANHFESNSFREAQAHINFPYGIEKPDADSFVFYRNQIIPFTELNHNYINPEAEKYSKLIEKAFSNLNKWIDKSKAAGDYNSPESAFNEYVNWALVSLYFSDILKGSDFNTLKASIEKTMARRGFLQFIHFQNELLRLYQNEQKPVANLYPQFIEWAARQK